MPIRVLAACANAMRDRATCYDSNSWSDKIRYIATRVVKFRSVRARGAQCFTGVHTQNQSVPKPTRPAGNCTSPNIPASPCTKNPSISGPANCLIFYLAPSADAPVAKRAPIPSSAPSPQPFRIRLKFPAQWPTHPILGVIAGNFQGKEVHGVPTSQPSCLGSKSRA